MARRLVLGALMVAIETTYQGAAETVRSRREAELRRENEELRKREQASLEERDALRKARAACGRQWPPGTRSMWGE